MSEVASHIGTLREKPLHASLKRWYARDGDRVEVPVDGFVIDLVRGDLLIEVQTRGFSSMRQKVEALLESGHRMRIVHPIAVDTWIVKVETDGTILDRRRSPRHGTPADVFAELVSIPTLAADPRLEIDLVMITQDEYRCHTPNRSWRRKGWSVMERRLVEVGEVVSIRTPDDLAGLLPADLPDPFTTADLCEGSKCPRRVAQQMAYCLRIIGVIDAVGKRGNAIEYRLA